MRLIDADELIKCIPSEEYNSRFAVMNAPTINPQPEIIRCKDCRYYEFKQGSLPWNYSRRYCNRSVALSTQENDYCSYAELRGDSDEQETTQI